MPAENRNSESSPLNWEEFFGSSNSDLLPCLLSVYDSIAAARKLEDNGSSIEDCSKPDHLSAPSLRESDIETAQIRAHTSHQDHVESRRFYYNNRKLPSRISSTERLNDHYNSTLEISNGGASVLSKSSECIDGVGGGYKTLISCTKTGNTQSEDNVDRSEQISEKYLDNLVVDDNRREETKTLGPQSRTSYTTASQYSEDSGIYSNLIRCDSLQERSWFDADGEDVSYMNRVIHEILESEFVYVNDLQQIISGYLDEWRSDQTCALSAEQINDLFSNIEEIYNFNRCFLWELEQCRCDSVKIARCFVENNSNFSIYAAYCTHYPKSINILTDLMRQDKTAHIFRERQISLHHKLPLGSYLLKPVQRILKYHLLLENMVKYAPPDMLGYKDITVALSTMTGIAHHINTMKRRHEHAVRVQEVQSLLTGWQGSDLTTFGELYAEGSFHISGAKATRHIFLFEHMLLVTKKKEAGVLNYKTHILCSNLMLVECVPKERLSFQIIPFDHPRMQFTVHARSLEEKRYWTLELKRVILENYSADIPSHARQLVMELGQVQATGDMNVEKVPSYKRQRSTPEYLEKRKSDKGKKKCSNMKSRIRPLFKKLDSLQKHKVRRKVKKNYSFSENSISDTSIKSDELSVDDTQLLHFSKTTDDLSETCDKMARTLEGLSRCSTASSSADNRTLDDSRSSSVGSADPDEQNSYEAKEKLIAEIIGQLLVASQKFQKAIKQHERSMRAKRRSLGQRTQSDATGEEEETAEEEEEEEEEEDDVDNTDYDQDSDDTSYAVTASRADSKDAAILNTSTESLSASLKVLTPTTPNVWLKQQRQHLATPQNKADSLPRTFQLAEDEWRSIRPKTIASDKPSRMANMRLFESDEIQLNQKVISMASLASASLSSTTKHPDCKFYRTSAVRMTVNKMMHTIGTRLSSKRVKAERFYKVEHGLDGYRCRHGRKHLMDRRDEDVGASFLALYKQGSSDLGARIANGKEISDYADPKVLFPTITPSKKAASILGVRAFSSALPQAVVEDKSVVADHDGSDCSADSFYERQFEKVECEFYESSILDDHSPDTASVPDFGNAFRNYSRVSVNISVHKPIKIPPPVPARPNVVRSKSDVQKRSAFIQTKASPSPNKEFVLPARGWVKQVVDRFQSNT